MAIKIIKKINLKTVELKPQAKAAQPVTAESVVKGWIIESHANKQAQAKQARKFWGIT